MHLKKVFLLFVVLAFITLTGPAFGQVYNIRLDGSQASEPNDSEAVGNCLGYLNEAQDTFQVICSHDVENVTGAHIHRGPAGVNGPIVFPFDSPESPFKGSFAFTPADVEDLDAGDLYVNVHSDAFPGGEIRGQIGPPSDAGVVFDLETEQEEGPGGICLADLNPARSVLSLGCSHNVEEATAAHIHRAPPGVDGPIVFGLTSATTIFDQVSAADFAGCPDFDAFLEDLAAGNLYVNVHTEAAPAGFIRGQIPPPPYNLYFSQFGSGTGFTSSITLINNSTTADLEGAIYFTGEDGGPLEVGVSGGSGLVGASRVGVFQGTPATFREFSIPALGSVTFETDGEGDLALGSAEVVSSGPIDGVIRFSIPDHGAAGLGAAAPLQRALAPVRAGDGVLSGVAVRNNESHPVTVNFQLRDDVGVVDETSVVLAPNARLSQFVNEIFEDDSLTEFVGTLLIWTETGSFSAIALELGPAGSGIFSSLPVAPVVGP